MSAQGYPSDDAEQPPTMHKPTAQRTWTTSPPESPVSGAIKALGNGDALDDPGTVSPLSMSRSPSYFSRQGFGSSRTRSVANLTASTLAGIYAPDTESSLAGIFGVSGAMTPMSATPSGIGGPRSTSMNLLTARLGKVTEEDRERDRMAPVIGAQEHSELRAVPRAAHGAVNHGNPTPGYVRVATGLVRAVLLFALGAAYGGLVTHLHDARNLAPVKIEGLSRGYEYTLFWGIAGIILGTALPIVDAIWEGEDAGQKRTRAREASVLDVDGKREGQDALSEAIGLGAEWNPMVRSIGAFIGVGFAIRRLPWQSTLQASVTLAMVNPCLWYMLDRTFPGFALATIVGIAGTSVLLGTNVVPMPDLKATIAVNGSVVAPDILPLGIEQSTFAIWVWIASVLFCSCVCFGNIGRRLAVK